MVESSSSRTQHRGTKATKGERGYFITAAEPPSVSLVPLLATAFFPYLRLRVVPVQIVTIQGDKTVSFCDGFNASQASRVYIDTCMRKTGGLPHKADNMDGVISALGGHSDGGNRYERTSCEGHCGTAEAYQQPQL